MEPQYNIKQISVGCLYLLTNKATLYFPGSDRSKPSGRVVVDLATKGLYRESDRAYFPFWLGWAVWHDAIVPVLENKDVRVIVTGNPSLRVHQNKALLSLGLYDELIEKISSYLVRSLVAHGYLPSKFAPVIESESSLAKSCPGPSVVDWSRGPDGIPQVDPGLTHPDGTPKQEYPIVDPDLSSSC